MNFHERTGHCNPIMAIFQTVTQCAFTISNLHMIEDISKTSQASGQCALSCIASNKLIEQKSYHSFGPSLRSMEDRGMP